MKDEGENKVLFLPDKNFNNLSELLSSKPRQTKYQKTERGMLHALQKKNPDQRFYSPSPLVVCRDMKLTKLENVFRR